MKQERFSDMEYRSRKKKTKRGEFHEIFQLPPDLREILDTLLAMEKEAAYPADF